MTYSCGAVLELSSRGDRIERSSLSDVLEDTFVETDDGFGLVEDRISRIGVSHDGLRRQTKDRESQCWHTGSQGLDGCARKVREGEEGGSQVVRVIVAPDGGEEDDLESRSFSELPVSVDDGGAEMDGIGGMDESSQVDNATVVEKIPACLTTPTSGRAGHGRARPAPEGRNKRGGSRREPRA